MKRTFNRYFDARHQRLAVRLLPGQFYATVADEMLVTVLGSCVSACIRDAVTGCGGMNHFLLPSTLESSVLTNEAARYGVHAMELLLNALFKRGARRERLEAKVFGGASVMSGLTTLNVGAANASFVQAFLKTERIAITASDLEGSSPRRLHFFPKTGKSFVKYLHAVRDDTIALRERELLHETTRLASTSTLFVEPS